MISVNLNYETYAHRFADIILNSDYSLKGEIELVVKGIDFTNSTKRFKEMNKQIAIGGNKTMRGNLFL